MTDEAPAQSGDTSPGSATGATGDQAPSGNPGVTVDQIKELLASTLAPMQEEIARLKAPSSNAEAAARRVASKGKSKQDAAEGGGDGELETLRQELDALRDAEKKRQDRDQRRTLDDSLSAALKRDDLANSDLLAAIVKPNLTLGTDGSTAFVKVGDKLVALKDHIEEVRAQDKRFQKAASGDPTAIGTGDDAGKSQAQTVTPDDVANMSREERDKFYGGLIAKANI